MPLPSTEQLTIAAASVRHRGPAPELGVVLGSGLGDFVHRLQGGVSIPYSAIPGMPEPRVSGHAGKLWLGRLGDHTVACLQGRVHAYEGHATERICFGVSLLAELGCRSVILTNAAGGIDARLTPGDLLLITDHLNLTGRNPLVGAADGRGPDFLDLSEAYDPKLQVVAHRAAISMGIELHEGVYAAMLGPSYETPAEIRMLATLGASCVGMSTVLEVLALRYLGVSVGALSCITNYAAGLGPTPLTHEEVKATAASVGLRFQALLEAWLMMLP